MNFRNGDPPYRDTLDAIAHWPETATAIAARSNGNRVELLVPYGVHDLLNLILRPTPAFLHKVDVFRQRVREKDWLRRWPKLIVCSARRWPTSIASS